MATNQITGTITTGVTLTSALYYSPVTVTNTANVSGSRDGIYAASGWTIDNTGTIESSGTNGIYLSVGGSVTNEIGGVISGNMGGVFIISVGSVGATLDNAGTIESSGTYGAFLLAHSDGSATNEIGGSISGGTYGIILAGTNAAVGNAGAITGTSGAGIYLAYGGSVINAMDGSIGGNTGVLIRHVTGTVDNSGSISGTGVAAGDGGVVLASGGSVTNETGGSISGGFGIYAKTGSFYIFNEAGAAISGGQGVFAVSAFGTVVNDGTITSGSANGVNLDGGGSVTNQGSGSISGSLDGIHIAATAGTVDNAGTITGAGNEGVELSAGGSVTNTATGYIYGIIGVFSGSDATVENAGTIIGRVDSVFLNGSGTNRLIVDTGAVFQGTVKANSGAANTLELTSGTSVGTISGLGSQYRYFQTVTIDNHAGWDIGGATVRFGGTTIDGFNSHDRLDLTDIGPAGYSVSLDSSSNMLTIEGSSDTVTIQFDSSVTGDTFQLLSDGNGGTFVEESDYTPCYCRGTRVRTPEGEVAVEMLKIGDLVVIKDGDVLPIKWIGRRSYRDWLAIGNSDVQPILFKAGSIADHVPARDLYVSPEHAMLLDGMLVPALHLVNRVSIVKVEGMEEVEYFHLEFDRHVVILAEGAAAESFIDDDSRMLFHNADEYRRLYPNEPRGRYIEFCAPRVETGAAFETLHHRLMARATLLTPGGKPAPAATRQGYLDRATHAVIEGWAVADAGEAPVKLAIIVNGAVIGQTVADRYRADVAKAGVGDGRCGFRFDLPHGLSPVVSHRIEVRRESDWSLLTGGCVTLEPEAPYSAASITRISRSAESGPRTLSAS